ncbi:MAG: small multi-drug export protein [Acutalibacteraceae bacterium]|nr:small multi-drug export protein [Acutalibacteraceae bacterium]
MCRIPLPGTSAWTGALVAALFKFKIKDAVISIGCGVLGAATIMTVITYVIPWLIKMIAGG